MEKLGLMSYQQVSEFLQVSKSTLLKWAKRGIITPIVFSKRTIKFERTEILGLAEKLKAQYKL